MQVNIHLFHAGTAFVKYQYYRYIIKNFKISQSFDNILAEIFGNTFIDQNYGDTASVPHQQLKSHFASAALEYLEFRRKNFVDNRFIHLYCIRKQQLFQYYPPLSGDPFFTAFCRNLFFSGSVLRLCKKPLLYPETKHISHFS